MSEGTREINKLIGKEPASSYKEVEKRIEKAISELLLEELQKYCDKYLN